MLEKRIKMLEKQTIDPAPHMNAHEEINPFARQKSQGYIPSAYPMQYPQYGMYPQAPPPWYRPPPPQPQHNPRAV